MNAPSLSAVYRVMVDAIYPDLLANLRDEIMAQEKEWTERKKHLQNHG